MLSDVEGLRGWYICDVEGCRQFRSALSYSDRIRISSREYTLIGQSRVYPAGANSKFDEEV